MVARFPICSKAGARDVDALRRASRSGRFGRRRPTNGLIFPIRKTRMLTARSLGQAIRRRRVAAGLTQRQLAAACGVGERFIIELEKERKAAVSVWRFVSPMRLASCSRSTQAQARRRHGRGCGAGGHERTVGLVGTTSGRATPNVGRRLTFAYDADWLADPTAFSLHSPPATYGTL